MGKPTRKTEFAGVGCLIQGLGLVVAVLGFAVAGVLGGGLGLIVGIVLFLVGSSKSSKWICPECRNSVAAKDVKVCPACRVRFE